MKRPLSCDPKKELDERKLLEQGLASDLENLFKVLANDTRLRILHALVISKELCVNEIADTLEMKPQAISNQLQRLADQGILNYRRDGNSIYYHIVDPCVITLLDQGLCLLEDSRSRSK